MVSIPPRGGCHGCPPTPLVGMLPLGAVGMSRTFACFLQQEEDTKENSFKIWSLGRFYGVTLNFRCPFDSLILLATEFGVRGT